MTELFGDPKEREFIQSWSGVHQALLQGLVTSLIDENLADSQLYIDSMLSESAGLTDEQKEVFLHMIPKCLKATGATFQDELLKSLKAKGIDFLTVK